MARDDSPPFEPGTTWYGGATIDTNDLGGINLEGKEYVFEDIDQSVNNGRPLRSGKRVRRRVVRNVSGTTLYPKRLVSFQTSAGSYYNARVDGNARVEAQRAFPVDEWLSSNGVPTNDLFYIVVEGPAMMTSDDTTLTATINVGDQVIAATAANSTNATLGGKFAAQTLAQTQTALADNIRNAVGRALTARTANNTNTDTLIDVGRW